MHEMFAYSKYSDPAGKRPVCLHVMHNLNILYRVLIHTLHVTVSTLITCGARLKYVCNQMLEQMLNCDTVTCYCSGSDGDVPYSLQNMSCKLCHRDIILTRPLLGSRGLRPICRYLKHS